MAANPNVDTIRGALNALYRGSSQVERQKANQWLVSFLETKEAWAVAHQLLRAETFELQYFGANTLLTKLNRDYNTLTELERKQLNSSLMDLTKQHCTGTPALAQKLAACVSVLATRTSGGCRQLVSEMLRLAEGGNPSLVLNVLSSLPEQVDRAQLTYQRREEAKSELTAATDDVLQFLLAYVSMTPFDVGRAENVLSCLTAWVRDGVSLSTLLARNWLNPLLQMMGSSALATHAADILVAAQKNKRYMLEPTRKDALSRLLSCAASLKAHWEAAVQRKDDRWAFAIAQLSTSIGDLDAEAVAAGGAEANTLVELQLSCLKHSDLSLSEMTLDFWHSLQEIPVEERPPAFRQPLYLQVVSGILQRGTYPADFVSWERSPVSDPETFKRFRDNAKETLIASFYLLNATYLTNIAGMLTKPSLPWQMSEVLIWAASVVANEIVDEDFGDENRKACAPSLAAIVEAVMAVFKAGQPHPALIESCVKLLGSYAFFIRTNAAYVRVAAACLLQAAPHSAAAGVAFMAFTRDCRAILSADQALVESWSQLPSMDPLRSLSPQSKECYLQGIATVIAALTAAQKVRHLERIVASLVEPLRAGLTEVKSAMASGGSPSKALQDRMRECVRATFAHLEAIIETQTSYSSSSCSSSSSSSSAAAASVDVDPMLPALHSAWEPLTACARMLSGHAETTSACCRFLEKCLRDLKPPPVQLLTSACGLAIDLFARCPESACLDVLTAALSRFSAHPDAASLFGPTLHRLFPAVAQLAERDAEAHYDVLGSFFRFAGTA